MLSFLKVYFKDYEFREFLLWLFLFIISKFILGEFINQIVYLIFFITFYYSKRDAIWIAIAIVTTDFPGGFLSESSMIFIPAIRDFSFHESFILVAFLKSLKYKKYYPLLFRYGFLILAIYIILLFFYSLGLGASFQKVLRAIRYLFMWSLLFSLPRLLNYSQIKHLFDFIFYLMPIGLIIQLLGLFMGVSLGGYFFGENILIVDTNDNAFRIVYGVVPAFFAMVGSFIYYKKDDFPRILLNINIVLSFIFIVSTSTRGWTIGYVAAMIFFFSFIKNGIKALLQGVFIFILIIITLISIFPKIGAQLTFATERLMTVESIAKGDLSANNSLSRLTDYAPVMESYFLERPFLGYGLLDAYSEVSNDHLGYHNHLLVGGIIGFLLTYGFILFYLFNLSLSQGLSKNKNYSLMGVIAGFIFILLTNSGACMITFINTPYRQLILSLLFTFGSAFYYEKFVDKENLVE